jgi:hypothetical protein
MSNLRAAASVKDASRSRQMLKDLKHAARMLLKAKVWTIIVLISWRSELARTRHCSRR